MIGTVERGETNISPNAKAVKVKMTELFRGLDD